jgi:gamma-glutamyltranspeptidase/glutathione hydrolase
MTGSARPLAATAACLCALLAAQAFPAAAGAPVRTSEHIAAAANPHAAAAAAAMLERGGSAVDAAIAAQLVLGLVEPQSSGIGGGAFLLHFSAADRRVVAYDGRETAPASATPDLFIGPDGAPMAFSEAVVGGRAVGVPGVMRMLERAHRAHGKLPWRDLFAPAIHLAEDGFVVSPRLHALIAADRHLAGQPAAAAYFFRPDGKPRAAGERLLNPAYADTLRRLATEGADALYRGAIARDIVDAVQRATNPGGLSEADLAAYGAVVREPLCEPYRRWTVCGMPPPTSGGIATLQILGLLQPFDLARLAPGSAEAVHLISEASRLAYADRARYVADADHVAVPVRGLLDRAYLAGRAALIRGDRTSGPAEPGIPDQREGRTYGPGATLEMPSTSHVSIVDAAGDAVAMTTSIENVFGSRLMVRGFLLNNQLTDFSFRPGTDAAPVANAVAPGKRPRSSMSPTLVLGPDGRLVAVVGSPGGSRIIAFVAQTLVALLDWNLDAQAAVDLPRHVNRNGATEIEAGTDLEAIVPALEALGHDVRTVGLVSGLHVVRVDDGALEGGADPRREGVALGK